MVKDELATKHSITNFGNESLPINRCVCVCDRERERVGGCVYVYLENDP